MIPLLDDNPRRGRAFASLAFLLVHLLACVLGLLRSDHPLTMLGYVVPDDPTGLVARRMILLYVAFMVAQLATLRVVADNVEDRLGTPLFVPAYLSIGILGWLLAGGPEGRSGGFLQATTAAMIAAYTVFFPAQEVTFAYLTGRRGFSRGSGGGVASFGILVLWLHQAGVQVIGALLGYPVLPALAGVAGGLAIALATEKLAPQPAAPARNDAPIPARRAGTRRTPAAAAAPARGAARAAGPADLRDRARRLPASPPPPPPAAGETDYLETGASAPSSIPAPMPAAGAAMAPGAHWGGRYGVVRLDDALRNIERLGRLVHAHTHEALFDATRRLKHSRGLLAAGMAEAEARALAEAATAIEVPAIAVPWPEPPILDEQRVIQLAWSDTGIAVRTRGEELLDLPWRRILVAAGTRLERPALRPSGGIGRASCRERV